MIAQHKVAVVHIVLIFMAIDAKLFLLVVTLVYWYQWKILLCMRVLCVRSFSAESL